MKLNKIKSWGVQRCLVVCFTTVVLQTVWGSDLKAQIDTLHIHYFPNGEISTFFYIDNSLLRGKALAYNFEGEVIYERETRRMSGSAGVSFTHHKNGLVHTANFSSHPCGGIQWMRIYTIFNEKGEKVSEKEEVHDPLRPSPYLKAPDSVYTIKEKIRPVRKTEPVTPTPKQREKEVVQCAGMHQNHTTVINHTRFKI